MKIAKIAKIGGLLLALLLGTAGVASATATDILLVYNGQTQVNRETYMYIQRGLQMYGVAGTLKAGTAGTVPAAGTYKAVVVLNTGVTSGIDPVLQAFIDKYPTKKDVYVVTLVKGANNTNITKLSASATGGVDGVSAASYWAKGPGGNSANAFHDEWLQLLVAFLKTK